MQNGVKSEGWLLTDGASWRHDNGGVDAQNRQIKTHKHTTDGGRRNRTNRIKIRQKEIKVRMNDVSVVAGGQSISGTAARIQWLLFAAFLKKRKLV